MARPPAPRAPAPARHARARPASSASGRASDRRRPSTSPSPRRATSAACNVNTAPPSGALAAVTVPPMLLGHLTHDRQAEPAALAGPRVWRHGRSGRRRTGGRPGRCPSPWSRTRTPSASTVTSTVPPGGEWRAALSSRLLTARARRSATAVDDHRLQMRRRTRCPEHSGARGRPTPRRPGRAGRPRAASVG